MIDTPFAWMFVDMNSFFASVEQHLRPALRGCPVGIVPVESDNTCIIAASGEAKSAGVRTGTRVREARKLCPGIRLIRARPSVYVRVHHAIARSLEACAPIHRAYSIDEWAIRLVGDERTPEAAAELAERVQRQIREDHSAFLPCSVGVSATRLLAKIACELKKPNGLTVLPVEDLPGRLDHLKPADLPGIGRGMGAKLGRHGVASVRDLWSLTRHESVGIWGSVVGGDWWDGFHGHDQPELKTSRRSMSHANVLEPKFRTDDGAREILVRLTCRLGRRLREAEHVATAMHLSVSTRHGGRFAAKIGLDSVQDTPALLDGLARLWEMRMRRLAEHADPILRPGRAAGSVPVKVGVMISGLIPADQVTQDLFRSSDVARAGRLSKTMDAINRRWGVSSLYVGSMHECRQPMDEKIAFGRIPSLMEDGPGDEL